MLNRRWAIGLFVFCFVAFGAMLLIERHLDLATKLLVFVPTMLALAVRLVLMNREF